MIIDKKNILKNICYTDQVYLRINKKLNIRLSNKQIEELIFNILNGTDVKYYSKIGKNFYIMNTDNNIRITINSNTFRVITVDKLENIKQSLL